LTGTAIAPNNAYDRKAPFSHDAEAHDDDIPTTWVPVPSALLLVIAGVASVTATGAARKRKRQ